MAIFWKTQNQCTQTKDTLKDFKKQDHYDYQKRVVFWVLHILKPTGFQSTAFPYFRWPEQHWNCNWYQWIHTKMSARSESFTETHFSYLIPFISTTAPVFCCYFPYNTNFKKWYLEAERKNEKSRWLWK